MQFMLQEEQGDKQQLEKYNDVEQNIDAFGKLFAEHKRFQTNKGY